LPAWLEQTGEIIHLGIFTREFLLVEEVGLGRTKPLK